MLEFWKNPEFVRHVRAEVRPVRALTAAVVVVVVCFLGGVGISSNTDSKQFLPTFYYSLLGGQFLLLSLWGAATCAQSIARERELKTHDFIRTTRLTSGELVIGKLLGAPVLAYFVVACSLPVSLVSGVLGGISPLVLLKTYVLMLVFSLFLGLLALWMSMQADRSNVAALVVLLLWPLSMMILLEEGPFPGFAAMSPITALASWYASSTSRPKTPTVFGWPVSYGWLSLLLYVSLGAWLMLMLVRNLKRDLPDIHLLSRPQALGLTAYLNLLCYAFVKHDLVSAKFMGGHLTPQEFSDSIMVLNAFILFIVGVAMLTTHEDLKVWWRRRAAGAESYWSERGLAWPWMLMVAVVAYALLAVQAMFWKEIPLGQWPLRTAACQIAVLAIFIVRDLMFIQSCYLTAMRRPLAGGILYLALYYFAVSMLALVVDAIAPARVGYVYALQPFYVMAEGATLKVIVGAALQVPVIALLLWAIERRLGATALSEPQPQAASRAGGL